MEYQCFLGQLPQRNATMQTSLFLHHQRTWKKLPSYDSFLWVKWNLICLFLWAFVVKIVPAIVNFTSPQEVDMTLEDASFLLQPHVILLKRNSCETKPSFPNAKKEGKKEKNPENEEVNKQHVVMFGSFVAMFPWKSLQFWDVRIFITGQDAVSDLSKRNPAPNQTFLSWKTIPWWFSIVNLLVFHHWMVEGENLGR